MILGQRMRFFCGFLFLVAFSWAQAEEAKTRVEWVFPGEDLRGETFIFPMSVGSEAEDDLQLRDLDWFQLKTPSNLMAGQIERANSASGVVGPMLNGYNAQNYFRMMTGMILQETLKQYGLKAIEAKVFLSQLATKGVSVSEFDFAASDDLPSGISLFSKNFQDENLRLSTIPQWVLPLAVAFHSSSLRHFAESSASGKTCTDQSGYEPLVSLAPQLEALQQQLVDIENKESRLAYLKLKAEQQELFLSRQLVQSQEVANKMATCVASLQDRLSGQNERLQDKCDKALFEMMSDIEKIESLKVTAGVWADFIQALQASGPGLLVEKFQLAAQIAAVEFLNKLSVIATVTQAVEADDAKNELARITGARALLEENSRENRLALGALLEEEAALVSERETLVAAKAQWVRDTGLAQTDGATNISLNDDSDEAPISFTGAKRLAEVEARLTNIPDEKKILEAELEFFDLQLNTLEVQKQAIVTSNNLGPVVVPTTDVAALRKALGELDATLLVAAQVVESTSSQSKAQAEEVETLIARKAEAIASKEELTVAHTVAYDDLKKGNGPRLVEEIANLKSSSDGYMDGQLSWFFETDCESFPGEVDSTYVARPSYRSEQSFWGAFGMNQQAYPSTIESGALLNFANFNQISVQALRRHYQYMVGVSFSKNANCVSSNQSNTADTMKKVLKASYALWTGGDLSSEQNTNFCHINTDDVANFESSLNQLVQFDEGWLDKALPQEGIHAPHLVAERNLVVGLLRELRFLWGLETQEDQKLTVGERGNQLTRAVIEVLAKDYTGEINEGDPLEKAGYKIFLGSEAPGGELMQANRIAVNSKQTVWTLGAVNLFKEPIDKEENKLSQILSFGDEVTILPINEDQDNAIKGNWVRVETEEVATAWMPSWALTYDVLVDSQGRALELTDINKCPMHRLVEKIVNYRSGDKKVSRFEPELKTARHVSGGYSMNWDVQTNRATSTEPTSSGVIHIACEAFSVPGEPAATANMKREYSNYNGIDYTKVQAVRVVEAKKVLDAKGRAHYFANENSRGGFVPTWLLGRNTSTPRLLMGPKLDKYGRVK